MSTVSGLICMEYIVAAGVELEKVLIAQCSPVVGIEIGSWQQILERPISLRD